MTGSPAQGVDLGAYNLREVAADAEDLRIALGIERWNLRGLGSGSRIAFEILRRYGEHVRAVWLDSPEIPAGGSPDDRRRRHEERDEAAGGGLRLRSACNGASRASSAIARNLKAWRAGR